MLRSMLGIAALAAVIAVMPLTAQAKHKGKHHGGHHHHSRGVGVGIVGPLIVLTPTCGRHRHWSPYLRRCVRN